MPVPAVPGPAARGSDVPVPTSDADLEPGLDVADVRFDDRGLVPAVAQQHDTGEVLMVAWMDRDALIRTLHEGEAVYWSRSRGELWHKGATSGDVQRVVEVRLDCDADTVLVLVDQRGRGACHTGERSCFGRRLGTTATPAATPPAPPSWPAATGPATASEEGS